MEAEVWPSATVAKLQAAGVLLVQDGNHGEYRPRPDEFVAEGVAFIRAADLDSGRVLFETASKINGRACGRITKGIGAGGDVLLSHKGTVGKVALTPEDAPSFVCSPQTTFWRTLNDDVLDRRYLYALLRSPAFQEQLRSRAGETDMAPYVSLTAQRGLLITLPPIDEQRAIAAILGALDDKIELNRRTNQTLEAIARALFKSWFVDFDPVRAKMDGRQPFGMDADTASTLPSALASCSFGVCPDGWDICTVGEILTLSRAVIDPTKAPDEVFDHFSIPSFDNGRTPKIELGRDIKSLKFQVPPQAVLLSKLNPHIPRVWFPDTLTGRQSICSTEFLVAMPTEGIPRAYLYSLFTSSAFADRVSALVSGTTGSHQRVRPESVLAIQIIRPGNDALVAFDRLIAPMLAAISTNGRQSLTLAAIRDTLLPKLLSGQIRIKDAERVAAEVTER